MSLTNIWDIYYLFSVPIKFLNCWWYSGCFQFRGQLTITVLCFRPPSPPTWIRWDVPSLRLEEMTTWEKPFTFSVSINLRKDYKYTERGRGLLRIGEKLWFCSCVCRHNKSCAIWIHSVCISRSVCVPDPPSGPQYSCRGRFLELKCQRWSDPSLLSADWIEREVEVALRSARHPYSPEPGSEAWQKTTNQNIVLQTLSLITLSLITLSLKDQCVGFSGI